MVEVLGYSALYLMVTGAVLYVLSGWYVAALLWMAKLGLPLLRAIGGLALYALFSTFLFAPMAGWVFVVHGGEANRTETVAIVVVMYVCSSLPAVVRFGRRRDELRTAGYKP